ncbi:MAG TPA: hypothetical protein VF526_16810 [Solirubrobacteraceae bacterium]
MCALPVTPAGAVEKAIWGPVTLPDGRSAFGFYHQLRVDTYQRTLEWSETAPERPASPTNPADPAYRWPAELDTAMRQADHYGIRVALMVSQTPAWANDGKPPQWAPDDPRAYADFLTAASRRYPKVRRWMIWGEPNRIDRFRPNDPGSDIGPRTYARLLDAAYGALKRQSSQNIVIGGMTWTGGAITPAIFIRAMRLANGRPPRLDWFGHNPFPFRFPDLANTPVAGGYRDISDIDTFGREIDKLYRRPKDRPLPLWLSEFLVQSDRGSRVFATFVSRQQQARWLSAAYRIADDERRRVMGLGWLDLLDEPAVPENALWGLLTYDLRPKPSFFAMQSAPSERLRPVLRVAKHARPDTLAGGGLLVTLEPRVDGPIRLELRRAGPVLRRVILSGHAGRIERVRLQRRFARSGRYTVTARSSRGATVDHVVVVSRA